MDEQNRTPEIEEVVNETINENQETEATEDVQNEKSPEEIKAERKQKFWKEVREWVVSLAIALLVVFVIRTFLFTVIRVDGNSMHDTLKHNERLFVTVADVKFGDVERGDVVICYYPNRGRTNFVKRVVAVPGDIVYREDGVTHVVYSVQNGNATEVYDEALDPNRFGYINTSYTAYEPYTLGEDEYFVVGDNRYNSHDSRDWNDNDPSKDVGPISKDMIIGRVRYVFWPLNEMRVVE